MASACGDDGSTDTTSTGTTTSTSTSTSTSPSTGTTSATGGGGVGGAGGAATGGGGAASGGGGAGGGSGGSGGGSGGSGGGSTSGGGGGPTGPVRIVAANLTSGNNQKWDLGHGIRILQGVHGDVLLVQEMNYLSSSATDLRSFADQVCGTECDYVRGPTATSGIPNGIVSRFPMIASGSIVDPYTTNRTFVWARIDVPGPLDLYAFSVHLLTSGALNRNNEAIALNTAIASMVPANDLLVVGGDFNTDTRDEAALMTLSSNFVTSAPYPIDQAANDHTNGPRTKPYDWVLVDSDLDALSIPVQIGSNLFPDGLVVDTRVYTPLSDLSPALMTDSGATNMQHMAVVRDFATE